MGARDRAGSPGRAPRGRELGAPARGQEDRDPGIACARARRGPAGRGDRRPVLASARGAGGGWGGQRDRHQRHGVGEIPVLQPSGARRVGARRRATGPLPLPDQGAGPGPGAKALRPRPGTASARDLRRRHPPRRPPPDQASLELDPHQPRHAEHRHPPPPQELGGLPGQPRMGRRRRGPHLSRRLRLARRQRPAPAAPRGGPVRGRSPLPDGLGDDRQPGRARRAPGRPALPAGRLRRRATSPAPDRDVEPAGDRSPVDDPPLGPVGGRRAPG